MEDTRHIRQLAEEITQLANSPHSPSHFFAEFLPRVLRAVMAPAGAVWSRTSAGHFELQHQENLAAVGLDRIENAKACREALLRQVFEEGRPLVVGPTPSVRTTPSVSPPSKGGEVKVVVSPPSQGGETVILPANLTNHGLTLVPIVLDERVAGVLEVWQEPGRDVESQEGALDFLVEMARLATTYLRNQQARAALGREQLWTQLEAYVRQIHGSLQPREVGFLVVNEGRRLLGCDRLSVALRYGRRTEVEAISGADLVQKRSRLVRAMRSLCERVLSWGERLVYRGSRDESLPPAVVEALDAYLAESPSKLLIVEPLRDEREKEPKEPCRSALLLECFEPALPAEQYVGRLEVVGRHATAALYNAVEHRRIPLRVLWQPLAYVRDRLRGKRWLAAGAVAAAVLFLAGLLIFVPYPLRVEAKGQLVPKDRHVVYATIHGRVVEVKAEHGEQVAKGQELLLLEDIETQSRLNQLATRVTAAQNALTGIKERLGKSPSDEERASLVQERNRQEKELGTAKAEQLALLQHTRRPLRSPAVAPLDGTLVTFDAQEPLVGKTVKPGDPLLRVARVDGPWYIELHIPENHIGPIREGLIRSGGAPVRVDLLLASHPDRTYQGWLHADGLGGETIVADNAVVLPARVELADPNLVRALGGMPVGVEVRAKVHCGRRPLGYVAFYELWEFFYEHVLF